MPIRESTSTGTITSLIVTARPVSPVRWPNGSWRRTTGLVGTASTSGRYSPPLSVPNLPLSSALPYWEVEGHLKANAGARPLDRDAVDARIIDEITRRAGSVPNRTSEKAGPGTGADGFPILQENWRELTIPSNPNQVIDAVGRTRIEAWLEAFARELEPASGGRTAGSGSASSQRRCASFTELRRFRTLGAARFLACRPSSGRCDGSYRCRRQTVQDCPDSLLRRERTRCIAIGVVVQAEVRRSIPALPCTPMGGGTGGQRSIFLRLAPPHLRAAAGACSGYNGISCAGLESRTERGLWPRLDRCGEPRAPYLSQARLQPRRGKQ